MAVASARGKLTYKSGILSAGADARLTARILSTSATCFGKRKSDVIPPNIFIETVQIHVVRTRTIKNSCVVSRTKTTTSPERKKKMRIWKISFALALPVVLFGTGLHFGEVKISLKNLDIEFRGSSTILGTNALLSLHGTNDLVQSTK